MSKVLTCRGCTKKKKCIKQGVYFNERCFMYSGKRKSETKQLDELWTKIVRLRSRNFEGEVCCEKCRSTEVVQGHHIIPRTQYGTRWELSNGVALCRKCHLYWAHKDTLAFYDWVSHKRDLERLELMRHNKPDKAVIKIFLEQELQKYS